MSEFERPGLEQQLRSLGEATEAAVSATDAAQVTAPNSLIDMNRQPEPASPPKPRRAPLVLAAAVLLVAVALGSALLIRQNDDPPAQLETASQAESESETLPGARSATETRTGDFVVPDDNGWQRLRFCESTDRYNTDAGNSFYGAYQFTWPSFRETAERLGMNSYIGISPATAPPEIQDAIANAIYLERGDQAWPVCGRFIEGPFVTPVVPQWMAQPKRSDFPAIVFLDPDVSDDRIVEISEEIRDIVTTQTSRDMVLTDQEEAYQEFLAQFEGQEQIPNSVRVEDMPPSFRLTSRPSAWRVDQLRDLAGVFEVLTVDPVLEFDPPPPMKLTIPAIALQTPVYPTASIEHLALGPAIMGGEALAPIIGGYGSVDGAVFADLEQLSAGDSIEVSMLIAAVGAPGLAEAEVTTRYTITTIERSPLDELPPRVARQPTGLVVVADAADPTERVVVYAEPVLRDTSGYGVPQGN